MILLSNRYIACSDLVMPPTLKKWGTYWFRLVCLYVCMYVRIHVRDIVLKLHVWIPHGKIGDAYFWFFPELSPLVKLRPFDKQGDEIL